MKKNLKRLARFLWNNKFYIIIMAIYTIIGFKILLSHEPWRDEAQAWLIGRDLSFFGMIKQMYYEGHPCLWSLILAPFAKMGFPYFTINIISYIITWISALLILKKAPFNKIVKIILIFSIPFMYNYSVIARNYCLIPLAFILIAINHKKRHEKPIQYTLSILFLAWTHIVMSGTAAILYFLFFWDEIITRRNKNTKEEKKKILMCIIIAATGLLLYVIPIGLGASSNNLINTEVREEKFYILKYVSSFIFHKSEPPQIILLGIILILFLIYEIIYYRKNLLIFLATIIYQIFVYYNVYYLSAQRCDIFIFLFMFIMWIQKNDKNKSQIQNIYNIVIATSMITLLCLYSISYKYSIKNDIYYAYSEAKNTGIFIQKNINNDSVIITPDMPQASSVIPFIDKDKNILFFGLNSNDYFTYVTWNYTDNIFDENYLKNLINTKFKNKENSYVLCGSEKCWNYQNLITEGYLKPVFYSQPSNCEAFSIYKVINN